MKDRMEDVEQQIGKLMRTVHLLSSIGEATTVESAKEIISDAEDVMNEVDMRDLCHKIDWHEDDDPDDY